MNDSIWMNSPIKDNLLEMFFTNSPIIIDYNFGGTQKIKYDNDDYEKPKQLVLGFAAGPLRCITHLIHEMAHLAEIDDARILRHGWGLTTPETYIPGRYARMAPVPNTYQPSLRECRVIAMQWQIQNYLGIEETPHNAIRALEFMSDWSNVPYILLQDNYKLLNNSRFDFLERTMLEYTRTYTLSFFMKEWKRKVELLQNHLNSFK